MPMPAAGTEWPPRPQHRIYAAYNTWSAWYSGDPQQLATAYGAPGGYPGAPGESFFARQQGAQGNRQAQYSGGIMGAVARWFWGQPISHAQRASKLHVPIAGDLCATSANLLFADRPTFIVDDTEGSAAQDRLDELFGEHTMLALYEAAEVCAALGGVYLRAGWDRDVADQPLVSAVHADAAIPVWSWGRLAEVTFHRRVFEDGNTVWRHLEHHAVGYVEHALFVGTCDKLGYRVPLTEHPDTANLVQPDEATAEGLVPTGLDRLDVVHWSNGVDRRFRSDAVAHHSGRPDLAGVESIMDALDEVYTSWMRDVRLGKARLFVPQGYLDTAGPGKGAMFDMDREMYVELNSLGENNGMEITPSQFAIRFAEHSATATTLATEIIGKAGYSAQTFGLTGDVAMTATESDARERKTGQTRKGKIRRAKLALIDLAEILLMLDNVVFGKGSPVVRPGIEFAPMVAASQRENAETAQLLRAAEAASTETLVAMVHPDWDDDQVRAEVDAITKQQEASMPPPPDQFGRPGDQPPPNQPPAGQ